MYALESGFGYVIADMFRKILNAEAPWNDDTKERMATARTALHTYVMHKFGHRMPLTPTAGYPWLRKAETAERNQKPGTNEVAGPTPPRPESDPVLHRPPKTGTILDESIAALTDLGFFDGLALVAQDEGDEGDFQVFRGLAGLNDGEVQTGRRPKVPHRGSKNDSLVSLSGLPGVDRPE
jgi:hypothetical protein